MSAADGHAPINECAIEQRAVNVHGVTLKLETSSKKILDWFAFDFRAFLLPTTGEKTDFVFRADVGSPAKVPIPPLEETMRGPHFVCFDDKARRYILYEQQSLLIYDYGLDEGWITAADEEVLYERLYLACLSRLGEKLDRKGLHRVHAMAISMGDRAHLFLMPPKTGKSSLGVTLLQRGAARLISDDTPLVTRTGYILPFQFRIGVTDKEMVDSIPPSYLRRVHGHQGDGKLLVDVTFWQERLAIGSLTPVSLCIGSWTTAEKPRLLPVSRLTGLLFLFRDCVIGFGIPQVAELFLTGRASDLLRKTQIAVSRMLASLVLASRCRCYRLYLCRDHNANADLVAKLLN